MHDSVLSAFQHTENELEFWANLAKTWQFGFVLGLHLGGRTQLAVLLQNWPPHSTAVDHVPHENLVESQSKVA